MRTRTPGPPLDSSLLLKDDTGAAWTETDFRSGLTKPLQHSAPIPLSARERPPTLLRSRDSPGTTPGFTASDASPSANVPPRTVRSGSGSASTPRVHRAVICESRQIHPALRAERAQNQATCPRGASARQRGHGPNSAAQAGGIALRCPGRAGTAVPTSTRSHRPKHGLVEPLAVPTSHVHWISPETPTPPSKRHTTTRGTDHRERGLDEEQPEPWLPPSTRPAPPCQRRNRRQQDSHERCRFSATPPRRNRTPSHQKFRRQDASNENL